MRSQFTSFLLAATLLGSHTARQSAAGSITVDFEDKSLPANSFYNGSDRAGGFTSQGAFFNNDFNPTFGAWLGWSYSNVNSTTTLGYTNQYAAITGTGVGGSGIYGVAFDFSPNDSFINLPVGTNPASVFVTNTTYAYLSMTMNGDAFAKKFTTGDFFKLEITGFSGPDGTGSPLGMVDFFLANYTSPDDHPVNTWSQLDLSSLAGSKSLSFGLKSSDNGENGVNTPAFFALDNLTVISSAVPEPGSLILLSSGMLGIAIRRMRRRGFATPLR
jgi:uncharacterized protein DUF4465/PEP-CTERM motif-containing protein